MKKCFKLEYSLIRNGIPEYNKITYTTAKDKADAIRILKWKVGINNKAFDITATQCEK